MAFKILEIEHREKVLEYILSSDDSNPHLTNVQRKELFDSLDNAFKDDYNEFSTVQMETVEGSGNIVYLISDPIKENFSATVRLNDTLYPRFKRLTINCNKLQEFESLYGGTVKDYIDARVRETLVSVETFPQELE